MEHVLGKTLLITHVIELIASNYNVSLDEARKMLYESDVIDYIDDDETGLYGESPLFVYSVFVENNKN